MTDSSSAPRLEPQKKQLPHPGTMYCSDPNCEYCKELRQAQEQLKKGKVAG
jgi:hypothetical protein